MLPLEVMYLLLKNKIINLIQCKLRPLVYTATLTTVILLSTLQLSFLKGQTFQHGGKFANNFSHFVMIPSGYKHLPDIARCKLFQPFFIKSAPTDFTTRQMIRETWAQEADELKIKLIFSLGTLPTQSIIRNEKFQTIIDREAEKFRDILQTNTIDTYWSLIEKVYNTLQFFTRFCDEQKYLFMADMDVLIMPKKLIQFLQKENKTDNSIWGSCGILQPLRYLDSKWYMPEEVFPARKYPEACRGPSYFMTGDVPGKLLEILDKNASFWHFLRKEFFLEDIAFTGLVREMTGSVKTRAYFGFLDSPEEEFCRTTISKHGFYGESFRKEWQKYKECK